MNFIGNIKRNSGHYLSELYGENTLWVNQFSPNKMMYNEYHNRQ